MASSSYIPSRDGDLALWAQAFAAGITANPTAYGLDATIAAGIQSAVDQFIAALGIATNPETRTKPTVADKDGEKVAMLELCRYYAQHIKANLGISDELKEAIGVPLTDSLPTPVPAPTTQPLLSIIGATPLQHTLRYADASTPDKRAKPAGATGLLLFVAYGPTVPTDPETAKFVGLFGRQPMLVDHAAENAGKTAYYCARWTNSKGQMGPWSGWVHLIIAG